MEEQVNLLERDHTLTVVLPGGLEKNATVHGSKPVMDLLVTLCASYHLNPSDYTVEVLSANKNNIGFKPNSPIGSLEAEKIVLKPRGVEEKTRRPYVPEASVRLLVNYNRAHKAVVRVSPTTPLEMLLPAICDKCEFGVRTTVLLRDPGSHELLDTSRTLNELGLRELFAKDTDAAEPVEPDRQAATPEEAAATRAKVAASPPAEELPKDERKHKKNAGFLGLFRKGKKKPDVEEAPSAPVSPSLGKQASAGSNGRFTSCSDAPADGPKKRRAPRPPMVASQSAPCHLGAPQTSAEPSVRSKKRRAPPPPRATPHQKTQMSAEAEDSVSIVEERQESDGSVSINLTPSPPQSSSPEPRRSRFSSSSTLSSLHDMVDPYLPSFGGKDLSDARSALAKVLTSSISRGALVRRLKNSAGIPKSSSTLTPESHGCFDPGVWADPESVPLSSLPTQPEWEEPVPRVAMTTFKVVPSKATGPQPAPDVVDQSDVEEEPGIEGSPDPQTEEQPLCQSSLETCSQEDPGFDGPPSLPPSPHSESQVCPDSPPTEVEEEEEEAEEVGEPEVPPEVIPAESSDCDEGEPLTEEELNSEEQREAPQSSTQSGSTDVELPDPTDEEKEAEGEVLHDEAVDDDVQQEVEEDAFPPPPSPVFFTEDANVLGEVEEAPQASCSPSPSQPSSPVSGGPAGPLGQDPQTAPELPEPTPEPSEKAIVAPSRFAAAVAMAVQKSRLQRQGSALGPQASSGPHADPPSSFYV